MSNDLNTLLFKRISPIKKLDLIENSTSAELKTITIDTIKRIIKEIGYRYPGTRDWTLNIPNEFQVSNSWNSWINKLSLMNGKLYVMLYLQYSNTDCDIPESYDTFFSKGDYRGSHTWEDRHGNPQTSYFTYSESDKLRCLRWLCVFYLKKRYKERFEKSDAT